MPAVFNRLGAVRLLHYWWPLALGYSLTFVVRRGTGWPLDPVGLGVLLTGIAAAYSIDRLIDRPAEGHPWWVESALHLVALAGGSACVALLSRLPLRRGLLGLVLAATALAYPWLKRLPLLKTIVVAAAWTWATVALPFDTGDWLGWRWFMVPVAWPMFLLIAAGCLLCDLKDAEADRAASVASLPVLAGVGATAVIACALALAGGGVAFLEQRTGMMIAALGLVVASALPRALAADAIGPLVVDVILTVPGVLVATRVV